MHFAGLYIAHKGYDKTAQALHFCGAGLVLAGIGLMGQVFHLHSYKGEAFLSWTIMILPLAILLRNGPIALMSAVGFVIWGHIYMNNTLANGEYFNVMGFYASVSIAAVMVGLFLREKYSEMSSFLQPPGIIGLIGWSYFFGFAHNFRKYNFPDDVSILPIIVLSVASIVGIYLFKTNKSDKASKYFILAIGANILTIALLLITFAVGIDDNSYFEHFSFGWTEKKYYLPLLISLSAWIGYFAIAFWGVIYGALNHHRWMLNCNIMLVGAGVFTRFIDLVGDMMDTGVMFIVCGLFLFAIGFGLEKWRRKLIAQAEEKIGS